LDFRECQCCYKAFSWEVNLSLGGVDFFDNTFKGFALEVFGDLFFISVFRKISQSPFDFFIFGPHTDFGHAGLFLSILVIVDMIALDVFSSQLSISF
jgi:hypothetical protein